MKTLLRQRAYRRLLGAGLVSLTGDWVLRIGLVYLVYDLTGSTLASSGALLSAVLPQVLLGSFAGVFADRWDRRRTLVVTDLFQALGVLPLLAVDKEHVWIVYAVALWQSVLSQVYIPAQQALVPAVVGEDDLLAANALNGQSRHLARLLGGAGGGFLAAAGGMPAIAVFDAATFAVSALLLAGIGARSTPPARPPAPGKVVSRIVDEWREGLRLMSASRALRTVFAFVLVTAIGEGILATLVAPWVRDVAHGDSRWFGLIMGAQAVGGVIGGLVAASVGRRVSPWAMAGWASVAFGLVDVVLIGYPVLYPRPWPAVVIIVVGGLPVALAQAGGITVIQLATEDAYRGRVLGAIGTIEGVAVLTGIGLAGALGEVVGILPVLLYQGIGYVLGGLILLARRPAAAPAATPP